MIARTTRTAAARLLLGASLLALPLASACRDSDDGGDDNGGQPDARPANTPDGGPDNPDDTTIYEIQGDLAEDLAINVRGVVVVAIDNHGSRTGTFYVAEPTGAREYSGVAVFGAQPTQLGDVAVGDLVDIEGAVKDEFIYGEASSFGPSLTQLRAPQGGTFTVTKVGTGTVPEPVAVDPVAIGALATDAERAAWEPWEGVLVRATNNQITAGLRQIGDDATLKEFQIKTETRVDSGLTELPNVTVGDCYQSITGIVDYFYNFKIVPRQSSDIVTTAGNCGDGPPTVTVEAIQRGEVTGTVRLNDVVVVARDSIADTFSIWVADAAQSAPYQGVQVYLNRVALPQDVTIGSVVDVAGTVDEFDYPFDNPMGDKLTELKDVTVTKVDTAAVTPLPAAPPLAEANKILEGESVEGVLVRFENLRVMSAVTTGSDRVTLVDGAGQTLLMEDDLFNYQVMNGKTRNPDFADGVCFSSVAGVMSLDTTADVRVFYPRQAEDLARVTCP
jgi:predicted extracellular nuclease